MSEQQQNLTIKQLFSEKVILNITLFSVFFIFTLAQEWDDIFLFLFPIITFCFSLFFKIIGVNKWRIRFEDSPIIYNPLGSEHKNSHRFMFCSLLLMLFLFWIGAESLYHPQLLDKYGFYFNVIFLFLYSLPFFWIFSDIWKYSNIKVSFKATEPNHLEVKERYEQLIRFLKVENFRLVSYINLAIFLSLIGLNVLLTWLTYTGRIEGIFLILPGTGIEFSKPFLISYIFFPFLIISPSYTIPLLYLVYRDINTLKESDLQNILEDLSENMRVLILENFNSLNKKLLKDIQIDTFIKNLEDEIKPEGERKPHKKIDYASKISHVHQPKEVKIQQTQNSSPLVEPKDITKRESSEPKTTVYQMKKEIEKIKQKEIASHSFKKEAYVIPEKRDYAKQLREEIQDELVDIQKKSEEHKEWVQKAVSDSILTIEKTSGRRACPKCNEDRGSMIHESIDKSNILLNYPRIYSTKFKCGKCGTEWREK
ncbi:MAG: conserved membrane protein of unknown function [Promethearchaeota archaeon]|nr:MAG: conserved membrane protein of unknown function [Candidatus Lokiarchaeota archaeon]